MRLTFTPNTVGACLSELPQVWNNRDVFPKRCDHSGPVRTVVDVEGDTAYTEVHELAVGRLARTETIVPVRIR